MQFWVCIEMHCTQIVWKLYKMWMIVFTQFRVRIGIHGCGKTTDVRCSDIQGKKFRCPILIPMFTCSVMLNYAGEAGDGRRQLTIISRLDKRLRLVIWMRMGVDNNRPPAAHLRLKMICNDFLVVKVNCWLYVFNIMKYVSILRNVKNKNIIEKNVWKCAPMICLLFTSDDVIPGKHNQTAYRVLNVNSWSRNNT